MLRSKRRSDLVVCFGRIDELLSSSGLHSLRTAPTRKYRVVLATQRFHFGVFFATAVQVGLDLDPKPDLI